MSTTTININYHSLITKGVVADDTIGYIAACVEDLLMDEDIGAKVHYDSNTIMVRVHNTKLIKAANALVDYLEA